MSIAPFARPVVPPVYWRNATSAPRTSGRRNGRRAPRASASRYVDRVRDVCDRHAPLHVLHDEVHDRSASATAGDRRSAIRSRASPACSATHARRSPRSSRARRSPARRCRRADARARAPCTSDSRSPTTSPARSAPKSATGDCSVFGSITATRSPFSTPGSDCKYAANARLSRSTSANVSLVPRFVNAGAAGEAHEARVEQAHRATGNGRDRSRRAPRADTRGPRACPSLRVARRREARARRWRTRSSGRPRSHGFRRPA